MDCILKWQVLSCFCMEYCQKSSPAPPFVLYNIVWFPCHSPKMACILLRALHDRFLTAADKSFSIPDQDACVPCCNEPETVHHLFFSCPYPAFIWSFCKLKLGMDQRQWLLKKKFLRRREAALAIMSLEESFGIFGKKRIVEYSNRRCKTRLWVSKAFMNMLICYCRMPLEKHIRPKRSRNLEQLVQVW